jgi:hypothetical protein
VPALHEEKESKQCVTDSFTPAALARVAALGRRDLESPSWWRLSFWSEAAPGRAWYAAPVDVPLIKGDLGPCSADFMVLDSNNKPVYDAKIHVTILYGFMNKRKIRP